MSQALPLPGDRHGVVAEDGAAVIDASTEVEPRCGYPKKDGSPCRNRVTAEGKVCRVHQKPALLDRILKRDVVPSTPADRQRPTS